MCLSQISASAGKGGRACSSPRVTKNRQGNLPAGSCALSVPTDNSYTVLLFDAPDQKAHVYCQGKGMDVTPWCRATGLHLAHLRSAFSSGKVACYEWQEEGRVYRNSLLPQTGSSGQVTHVLCVVRDISSWHVTEKHTQALHEGGTPKTFAQMLLAAREAEKREIAKALHDEIGTTSVLLAAFINMARHNLKKGDCARALNDLDRLQLQTQQSVERLRNIIVTLRPPSLGTQGALRSSLEELVKDVCTFGRLKYRFVCVAHMSEKGISDRVKILLYRLVQEALRNVVKHAQAHHVTVELKRVQQSLQVTVTDDGQGFVRTRSVPLNHIGLRSMQDGVRLLGGQIKILSTPGKGTQIKAICPCVVYEENE